MARSSILAPKIPLSDQWQASDTGNPVDAILVPAEDVPGEPANEGKALRRGRPKGSRNRMVKVRPIGSKKLTEVLVSARAERLRQVRKMVGATLEEVPHSFGISKHTFYAWESGRNPIRSRVVPTLISAFRKAGVYCSEDWLTEGEGISPRFMNERTDFISDEESSNSVAWESVHSELGVVAEIHTFQTVNKGTDVRLISDDAMAPLYNLGEYVGGVKRMGEEIASHALNYNCIVKTVEGDCCVRRVTRGAEPNRYTLVCLNPNAQVEDPLLYNVELEWAAPILWHRKLID